MKIYREIRIDIDTGETLFEDSFEYDGPLALCGGDDGSDSDGGYSSIGGPPSVNASQGEKDAYWGVGGINAFTNPNSVASGMLSDEALGGPGAVGVGDDSGGVSQEAISSAYSAPNAADTFWDVVELVTRAFSTVSSLVSGDIVGTINQGQGLYEHVTDLMAKYNDPAKAVTEAFSDFGISADQYSVDQVVGALNNEFSSNEGQQLINTLSSSRNADAANVVNAAATSGSSTSTSQTYNFKSYEDALKYATGSAAQRADEAWEMYKEFVVPYEQEFYSQARTLISPQMELARQYLDAQTQMMPGYTQAGIDFYNAAVEGVDPEQRADEAQAEVEQAFKLSDDITRRGASRMGLDLNDSAVLDSIKSNSLDQARGISGARTLAKNNADTENFQRLATAASMVPGSGQQGISFAQGNVTNPVSTAANQSGQAMSGATSGLNWQTSQTQLDQNQQAINQNEPYDPSFGDMLVNSALSGLTRTDWSKVF